MLALDPRAVDAAWTAVEPLLPVRPKVIHPLGTHRQRISDRECFIGILQRLVTGCSWDVAARLCNAGETTLRNRRTEWLDAGVFDLLVEEAINSYDRIIGLDLEEVGLDGSTHKAPFGGEGTGQNPTDRGKSGWKWSIATEANGIPIGYAIAGANRRDSKLLVPTLADIATRGLLEEIGTLHLDKGYDSAISREICEGMGINETLIAKKRKRGTAKTKKPESLGERWPVERTNSWLSNFGQLRRNTDRFVSQRLGQMGLAISMIIIVKLIKWAKRWNS